MSNLAQDVDRLWQMNLPAYENNLASWLNMLQTGEADMRKARRQFHQWSPLMVYVSVGKAGKLDSIEFSLRFLGQEVAQLVIREHKNVILKLNKGKSAINRKYFQDFSFSDGEYPWNGTKAKQFRTYFKNKDSESNGMPVLRSEEHRIESKFISEMLKGSNKFGGVGLRIKPVTISGCPLQFPVPISANKGNPENTTGHIDILARRKIKGNNVILSVWELKKSKEYKCAAYQAYIYALTLIKILRSSCGSRWYKAFGFSSPIPNSLEVEAVVAITSDQLKYFKKEKEELINGTESFDIAGDRINLHYVCYKEEPRSITITETSLTL